MVDDTQIDRDACGKYYNLCVPDDLAQTSPANLLNSQIRRQARTNWRHDGSMVFAWDFPRRACDAELRRSRRRLFRLALSLGDCTGGSPALSQVLWTLLTFRCSTDCSIRLRLPACQVCDAQRTGFLQEHLVGSLFTLLSTANTHQSSCSFLIDEFHVAGHSDCSAACSARAYMKADPALRSINTSVAESSHAALRYIRTSISKMSEKRASLFLHAVLQIHNRRRFLQLEQVKRCPQVSAGHK